MGGKPFLPKDNQELPDNYSIKFEFMNGRKEEYEVASHTIVDKVNYYGTGPTGETVIKDQEAAPMPYIELTLKDDEYVCIPIIGVAQFRFDKRWSKVVELRKKAVKNG